METQKNETDSRGRSFRREIGVFGGISIIAGIMNVVPVKFSIRSVDSSRSLHLMCT